MPYPPDPIVDNETVPVALPAVTGRLIVSSKIAAGSVSFLFVPISSDFRSAFLSKTNFVSSVRQRVSY